jgi:hypothetical protein
MQEYKKMIEIVEAFVVSGCYTVYGGSWLPTFCCFEMLHSVWW